MLQTFAEDRLLQLLKQQMGLTTSTCGVEVVTQQGSDVDAALRLRLQGRYLQLLLTADPTLLPTRDVSMQASSLSSVSEQVGKIEMPEAILRPVEIKLPEWPMSVKRFVDIDSPEGELVRLNPYSRSTLRPRVLKQGNILWLYETNATNRLVPEKLLVVMQPTDGEYTLDLQLLPQLLSL